VRNAEAATSSSPTTADARLTEASDHFHPIAGAAAVPKLIRRRLPF